MTYEEVLSHFTVRLRRGDKALCLCPAHDDKKASLSVSRGRKGTLIHCFAGCATADILREVNLRMSDLFYDSPGGGVQNGL